MMIRLLKLGVTKDRVKKGNSLKTRIKKKKKLVNDWWFTEPQ